MRLLRASIVCQGVKRLVQRDQIHGGRLADVAPG